MVYEGIIRGDLVELKAATVEDAEFTLSIRQDPAITKYLPKLDITIEDQRKWILRQREKEGDYFFVIWNKAGKRIGTWGIYDIKGKTGEGGRLASYGDAFQKIESGMLISYFQFEILKLEKVVGWVYADNRPVVKWIKWFGADLGMPEKNEEGAMIRKMVQNRDKAKCAREKIEEIMKKVLENGRET